MHDNTAILCNKYFWSCHHNTKSWFWISDHIEYQTRPMLFFFKLFKRLLTPSLWKFRSKFVLMPLVCCNKNLQNKAWICEKHVKYTQKSRQFYIKRVFLCQFHVTFISVLCQFYAKRPLRICNNFFEHGFDSPPLFWTMLKKTAEFVGDGIPNCRGPM